MLCYVNHPRKDVEGHWWLKKKPQIADGKNDRKKITLPGQLSSPGKKQREEQPTYSSCLASLLGKSAATQDQALRGSSQLHSVVVALGICCGFVRWWGCTLASQKSHKHNSGKKKKVRKQLILLKKLLALSFMCHNFLWYFPVLWSEKIILSCLLLLFFQGCWWWVQWVTDRPGSSKVKILLPLVWKLFRRLQG